MKATNVIRIAPVVIIGVQFALLGYSAWQHSPGMNEPGHLVAGISYWQFGTFKLYSVNPPLTKLVAAIPAVLSKARTNWERVSAAPGARSDWPVGQDFFAANASDAFQYLSLARWALVPVAASGGYVCFRWARELYGTYAGLTALTLWCFSPTILGWGATITADVSAAALGALATYLFWHWLKRPCFSTTFWAGLTLGLAELTKATWIVLFGLWPVLWFLCNYRRDRGRGMLLECGWLAICLLIALYVLNCGYGFEGSFTRLRDFTFESRALRGNRSESDSEIAENRYHSGLAAIRVPFPTHYVLGIDRQKSDFERGMSSYLNGVHKDRGWWYYYLYSFVFKEPIAAWLLFGLAIGLSAWRADAYSAKWRDELVLLSPSLVVFVLVSSQTGINYSLRYAIPCLPYVFIWISKVARSMEMRRPGVSIPVVASVIWFLLSSLGVYPHSISYFNEIAGGPTGGHDHLIDSNIDWGQDLWYLRKWYDEHPDARPLSVALHSSLRPKDYGILDTAEVPLGLTKDDGLMFVPGWYAISAHKLHDRSREYDLFLTHLCPTATAGYSIYIYYLSWEDANWSRRNLGLSELSASRRTGGK